MPWWSWALIGYAGLTVLFLAALATACGVTELRSRRQARRLIADAEHFLTEVALPVGTSFTAR